MEKMVSKKVPATLKYANPGAQPPIFVAGSFSDPAWEPLEMEYITGEDGEHQFSKEVMVEQGGQSQYKFRIGTGDWWALSEDAPIVTDDLGNKNNLLSFPSANDPTNPFAPVDSEQGESASKKDVDETPGVRQQDAPQEIPLADLIIEKVDSPLQHEDDFGSQTNIRQENAYKIKDKDAKLDGMMIESGKSTPRYAADAAEVADTAAILDHEASPLLLSNEEAGRIGIRRLSTTPIPEVALTAAEVADSAAILDQDELQDEMRISLPPPGIDKETPSGRTTPLDERVPLFSHECLDSPEYENHESSSRAKQREDCSPSSQIVKEAAIDYNDPTLEKFPTDFTGVLEQIRSIESRLSADEVRDDEYYSPVIISPKDGSPGLRTPSSTRLESKVSPLLEAISEESHFDEAFVKLPSPVGDTDERTSPQIDVISEESHDPEKSSSTLSPPTTSIEVVRVTKDEPTLLANSVDRQQQELLGGRKRTDAEDITEAEVITATDTQRKAEKVTVTLPLLDLETSIDEEEPADTPKLAESEGATLSRESTLAREFPKAQGPTTTKPLLKYEILTKAEALLNGEGSHSSPQVTETTAKDHDLPDITGLGNRESAAEEFSNAKANNEPEFAKPINDMLEGSNKVAMSTTDVSKGDTLHEIPENGIEQLQVHMVANEVISSVEANKAQDKDKQAFQSHKEQPKTNESQSEFSNMTSENPGLCSLGQAAGRINEIESLSTALVDELRRGTETIALIDSVSQEDSLIPKLDSLVTTATASSHSTHNLASTNELNDIPASMNESSQRPGAVVDIGYFLTQTEVSTKSNNEDVTAVATADTPEKFLHEDILVAVDDKHISGKVADEATSPVAVENKLHTNLAILNASKLIVNEDLPTATAYEDDTDIITNGEIPAITIDNSSRPFLVHAGQKDLESKKIIPIHTKGIDTATSKSLDKPLAGSNTDVSIKTRISSNIERPVTPASIHSALNPKESNNFFKALWRTVFVGWIGGLIHRIFGGKRSSLLTVIALLVLGGWYFSAVA